MFLSIGDASELDELADELWPVVPDVGVVDEIDGIIMCTAS
jgi:hypothetical protein